MLNPQQQAAVTAPFGRTLVLAGAGSGKTRIIIHKIQQVLKSGSRPQSILAITFTNKAANEIKARLLQTQTSQINKLWIGTFHSMAYRMLKYHWHAAGLPINFQIIDSEDQAKLIKKLLKLSDASEGDYPVRELAQKINHLKEQGLRSTQLKNDVLDTLEFAIYQQYEATCFKSGLLDFAELLLRVSELWLSHPEVLKHYQQRFSHILIDEFQDTNLTQYQWIKHLATKKNDLLVVGDDDQSIYSWRGALADNLQQYQNDFDNVLLIKLEQNYRSTKNILKTANVLIKENKQRLGKNLWTDGEAGAPVLLYNAYNDLEEARFVVEQIINWVEKEGRYSDTAILYRINALSRVFEQSLLAADIPYRIYGGLRFYERKEIKDVLCYLRLLNNTHDDIAFSRIINFPARGIGEKSLTKIERHAQKNNMSLWDAAQALQNILKGKANKGLATFFEQFSGWQGLRTMALNKQVQLIAKQSGVLDRYIALDEVSRIENIYELENAAAQFALEKNEENVGSLGEWLSQVTLDSVGKNNSEDEVQLMTLHSAKGLEFEFVNLIGMEEGLFPHANSQYDLSALEEERRLCYVGVTRAKQKLTLTWASKRRIYGQDKEYRQISRFINDMLPAQTLYAYQNNQLSEMPIQAANSSDGDGENDSGYQLGMEVEHPKFGEGVIVDFTGNGAHERVQVNFYEIGVKWLIVEFSRLEMK